MMETNRPKPHPPVKRETLEQTGTGKKVTIDPDEKQPDTTPSSSEKRPFIPKPHLTERPFKNHEGLQALKDSITPTTKPERRNARFSRRNSTQKGIK